MCSALKSIKSQTNHGQTVMLPVANTDEAGFGFFSCLKQQTLETLKTDLKFSWEESGLRS